MSKIIFRARFFLNIFFNLNIFLPTKGVTLCNFKSYTSVHFFYSISINIHSLKSILLRFYRKDVKFIMKCTICGSSTCIDLKTFWNKTFWNLYLKYKSMHVLGQKIIHYIQILHNEPIFWSSTCMDYINTKKTWHKYFKTSFKKFSSSCMYSIHK